jgi:eukaryotic-like serine/threonine-protein kinase
MTPAIQTFSEFHHRYPIRPADPAMLLGSGSYGKVVKVEDQLETEWVAVKISEYKGIDSQSLQAEVKLAQGIPRQGNIARYESCYRLATDTGLCDFAVMKYYPDGNLATLLKRATLTPQQTHDLTKGILLGLQHLHRHRIVHRDFKPANILISRDNQGRLIPKIADFGLSKLVGEEYIDQTDFELSDGRGTPAYKAPEQIRGGRVSFNLDLWAFGVILYEMLLGEKPFRADASVSSEPAARRMVEQQIVRAAIPDALNTVAEPYQSLIRQCLVANSHQRVRRADDLLALLNTAPGTLPTGPGDGSGTPDALPPQPDEPTDVFQEENTDVFGQTQLTELLGIGAAEHTDVLADVELPTTAVSEGAQKPVIPVRNVPAPPQPRTRWRLVTLVAVALAVIGGYVYLGKQPDKTGTQPAVAGILPVGQTTPDETPMVAAPATGAGADMASWLQKTRTEFYRAHYPQTVQLAEKGLHQWPKQPDLTRLKLLALDHIRQSPKPTAPASTTVSNVPEPVAAPAPTPTPDPLAEQKQAEQTYLSLLEQGAKAISNGNRKSEAIAAFTEARQVADKFTIPRPARHRELYQQYMDKGDRILANEEFKGALLWYQVAQAVENTAEIRAKIKTCTQNQQ